MTATWYVDMAEDKAQVEQKLVSCEFQELGNMSQGHWKQNVRYFRNFVLFLGELCLQSIDTRLKFPLFIIIYLLDFLWFSPKYIIFTMLSNMDESNSFRSYFNNLHYSLFVLQ